MLSSTYNEAYDHERERKTVRIALILIDDCEKPHDLYYATFHLSHICTGSLHQESVVVHISSGFG